MARKLCKSVLHLSLVGAINRKSSKICITAEACKCCVASYSKEELNVSKIAQLDLSPIAKQRSK